MDGKQEARLARFGFATVFAIFGAMAGAFAILGPILYGTALLKLTATKIDGFIFSMLIIAALAVGGSSAFLMDFRMAGFQVAVFIITCVIAWTYYRRLPAAW